ncbi:DUF6012 family protein [Pasteurella oralis]|uniref:DUF6012 family protein n=1 Tax=Pasteurella oralis TaxID=1071947 RepID=UPI000C79793A|nr:DUF6012 family protein [Pasteurella oralis]
MLIYLMPTFINPYSNVKISLERLVIIAGNDNFEYEIPVKELSLKRPYPNKHYWIACKKRKNKAFMGLLAHIEEEGINKYKKGLSISQLCVKYKLSRATVAKLKSEYRKSLEKGH